jgi:hypothetical protein
MDAFDVLRELSKGGIKWPPFFIFVYTLGGSSIIKKQNL